MNLLEEMPKPVIAQIHGACLGLGAEIALACDLRVMADDALFGLPETKLGLIPDVGGSSRLPAVVGLGIAKELIMTGRTIGAAECHRIGAANRVAPAAELEDVDAGARGRAARGGAARGRAREARRSTASRSRRSRRASSRRSRSSRRSSRRTTSARPARRSWRSAPAELQRERRPRAPATVAGARSRNGFSQDAGRRLVSSASAISGNTHGRYA